MSLCCFPKQVSILEHVDLHSGNRVFLSFFSSFPTQILKPVLHTAPPGFSLTLDPGNENKYNEIYIIYNESCKLFVSQSISLPKLKLQLK